jgi:hypothetical protein
MRWDLVIRAALDPASEAQRLHAKFRKDGQVFFGALRSVAATNGTLSVTEVLERTGVGPSGLRTRGSIVETRTHELGTLRGLKFSAAKFTPADELEALRLLVQSHRQSDPDASFFYVAGLDDKSRMAAARELQSVLRGFKRILQSVEDFRTFLEPSNIERLNVWSGHRFSEFPFQTTVGVSQSDGRRRLEFSAKGAYFCDNISSCLWDDVSGLDLATDVA